MTQTLPEIIQISNDCGLLQIGRGNIDHDPCFKVASFWFEQPDFFAKREELLIFIGTLDLFLKTQSGWDFYVVSPHPVTARRNSATPRRKATWLSWNHATHPHTDIEAFILKKLSSLFKCRNTIFNVLLTGTLLWLIAVVHAVPNAWQHSEWLRSIKKCFHRRSHGGPRTPKFFGISIYFVPWEAVSEAKYCYSPKIKQFGPPKKCLPPPTECFRRMFFVESRATPPVFHKKNLNDERICVVSAPTTSARLCNVKFAGNECSITFFELFFIFVLNQVPHMQWLSNHTWTLCSMFYSCLRFLSRTILPEVVHIRFCFLRQPPCRNIEFTHEVLCCVRLGSSTWNLLWFCCRIHDKPNGSWKTTTIEDIKSLGRCHVYLFGVLWICTPHIYCKPQLGRE